MSCGGRPSRGSRQAPREQDQQGKGVWLQSPARLPNESDDRRPIRAHRKVVRFVTKNVAEPPKVSLRPDETGGRLGSRIEGTGYFKLGGPSSIMRMLVRTRSLSAGVEGIVAGLRIGGMFSQCDPFGILSTSHWTGAVIIVQFPRTKTYIVTRWKTSSRPMPSSLAG